MNMKQLQQGAGRAFAGIAVCTLALLAGCNNSSGPVLASTSTSLTTSATTINTGGSVTLTSTLSGGSSSPKPIGVITFYDGSTPLQAITLLNGGTVSTTTNALAPGTHVVTASYYGDIGNAGSVSAPTTINVYQPTSITLTGTPTLAAVGDPVTLIASVNGGGSITAAGTVTFYSGTTAVGTASVVPTAGTTNATATLVATNLPQGVDTVTAVLGANGFFLTSTSNAVVEQIHGALIPTTLVVTTSPTATAASGVPVTLTATLVPGTASALSVAGTATFFDGTINLGTASFTAGQTATITTKQFKVGANSLTAVFSGDVVYGPSTSAVTPFVVTPYTGPTYTNPLKLNDPATGKVYNCPDPSVIKYAAGGANTWYVYCTGDTFNSADVVAGTTTPRTHLISIFSSTDLVSWTYVRDAFATLPTWIPAGSELQTPAIAFFNGTYHLYYYNGVAPGNGKGTYGPAIGVGTAATPAGPFVDSGVPVIDKSAGCGGGCYRTTFAPEVINDGTGQQWMVYGGSFGGISIRKLSADGFTSDSTSDINIGVDNLYSNPYILARNGYFYEFLSAGSTGQGSISSLGVRVGRSKSITGPYNDAEGNDLNAYSTPSSLGAPGGDPVLEMNGNDIVGAGSNTVITDESGQDYIVYSGVSQAQGTVPAYPGFLTARQLMMDPLDYINGFPKARGGNGPSDYTSPQPLPAAQPGATNSYVFNPAVPDTPGTLIAASSDEFNEVALNTAQWSFLHLAANYSMSGSAYTVQSANAESTIATSMTSLPILAEPEPAGNYLLEVKMSTTDAPSGYIFNYNSAGVFLYNSDTNYLRLDEVPVYETRQVEFLNQVASGIVSFAYAGTPNFAASTYLRIAKRVAVGQFGFDTYTAYTSTDGITYLKGPTWGKPTGVGKIGLYAGNTSGYTASFDYVRVSTLVP